MDTIGDRVRKLRAEISASRGREYTQDELATDINKLAGKSSKVRQQHINQLERPENGTRNPRFLLPLAAVLGVDAYWLLTGKEMTPSRTGEKLADIHRIVRHMETTPGQDRSSTTEGELTPEEKDLLAAFNSLSPESRHRELGKLKITAWDETHKVGENLSEGQQS